MSTKPITLHSLLRTGTAFFRFLFIRFMDDRCLQAASALAYTTLLSLVPLMALIFNTFSAFPAFKALETDIQNFIFSNFVPASGQVVQEYLQSFTQKTGKLTGIGIAALIVTALLTLKTIDNALNTIWRIKRPRRPLGKFLVYWAILTLGPLLVGVGILMTSYLASLPLFSGVEETITQELLVWLPFLTTGLAFTLIYLIIPNRTVPWRAAVISGILAAALFEAAKKSFALYVTHSEAYNTIYGTLATIPIFLLWIYISWVLILLGAEFAYCLGNFKREQTYAGMHESDSGFMHAYHLLGHLWQAQCQGKALGMEDIMRLEQRQNESRLQKLLERLEKARWIYRNSEESWGLARDLGETSLLELYHLMSGGLSTLPQHQDEWGCSLQPVLNRLCIQHDSILNIPLKNFYKTQENENSLHTIKKKITQGRPGCNN